MKHIKLFQKYKIEPEVGDYILADIWFYDRPFQLFIYK